MCVFDLRSVLTDTHTHTCTNEINRIILNISKFIYFHSIEKSKRYFNVFVCVCNSVYKIILTNQEFLIRLIKNPTREKKNEEKIDFFLQDFKRGKICLEFPFSLLNDKKSTKKLLYFHLLFLQFFSFFIIIVLHYFLLLFLLLKIWARKTVKKKKKFVSYGSFDVSR